MKRNLFLILVISALLFSMIPATVFADDSTTTFNTAAKDLSDKTEIYAVTTEPGSDYPFYGAKHEPNGGVYYGRIAEGGKNADGKWTVVNSEALANESAVSFYYNLGDTYGLSYWSYLFAPITSDGEHVLLINLNFSGESLDCGKVINGTYDAQLINDFKYLSSLSYPVFMRIGGEVNVWHYMPEAEDYIDAYRHIAKLARTNAPNTALVFAPNFTSSYGIDIDSFYPGDSYVDWVGVSLYYNKYAANDDKTNDAFYGVGDVYGDPMLNIQQVINLADLHSKPVIVTEGGAINKLKGTDLSSYVAPRIEKEFSFLTMVYPQIKCIIYTDSNFSSLSHVYTIYNNPTVTEAYNKAVKNNPTLVHSFNDKGAYYTPVESSDATYSGIQTFAAYSYSSGKLTARWLLDGAPIDNSSDYPYSLSLNTMNYKDGKYNLTVQFSSGTSKTVQIIINNSSTSSEPAPVQTGEPSSWAKTEVENAIKADLVPTELRTDYQSGISRLALSKMLAALLEKVAPGAEGTVSASFTDTEDTYVLRAASLGIINGYKQSDGTYAFKPENTLKRSEMTAIINRVAKLCGVTVTGYENEVKFTDTASHWCRTELGYPVHMGIVKGTSETMFSPENTLTVEQTIMMLYRTYISLGK